MTFNKSPRDQSPDLPETEQVIQLESFTWNRFPKNENSKAGRSVGIYKSRLSEFVNRLLDKFTKFIEWEDDNWIYNFFSFRLLHLPFVISVNIVGFIYLSDFYNQFNPWGFSAGAFVHTFIGLAIGELIYVLIRKFLNKRSFDKYSDEYDYNSRASRNSDYNYGTARGIRIDEINFHIGLMIKGNNFFIRSAINIRDRWFGLKLESFISENSYDKVWAPLVLEKQNYTQQKETFDSILKKYSTVQIPPQVIENPEISLDLLKSFLRASRSSITIEEFLAFKRRAQKSNELELIKEIVDPFDGKEYYYLSIDTPLVSKKDGMQIIKNISKSFKNATTGDNKASFDVEMLSQLMSQLPLYVTKGFKQPKATSASRYSKNYKVTNLETIKVNKQKYTHLIDIAFAQYMETIFFTKKDNLDQIEKMILIDFIKRSGTQYGVWGPLKRIIKSIIENRYDNEIKGVAFANFLQPRVDKYPENIYGDDFKNYLSFMNLSNLNEKFATFKTQAYLQRRIIRYLKSIKKENPREYLEISVNMLINSPEIQRISAKETLEQLSFWPIAHILFEKAVYKNQSIKKRKLDLKTPFYDIDSKKFDIENMVDKTSDIWLENPDSLIKIYKNSCSELVILWSYYLLRKIGYEIELPIDNEYQINAMLQCNEPRRVNLAITKINENLELYENLQLQGKYFYLLESDLDSFLNIISYLENKYKKDITKLLNAVYQDTQSLPWMLEDFSIKKLEILIPLYLQSSESTAFFLAVLINRKILDDLKLENIMKSNLYKLTFFEKIQLFLISGDNLKSADKNYLIQQIIKGNSDYIRDLFLMIQTSIDLESQHTNRKTGLFSDVNQGLRFLEIVDNLIKSNSETNNLTSFSDDYLSLLELVLSTPFNPEIWQADKYSRGEPFSEKPDISYFDAGLNFTELVKELTLNNTPNFNSLLINFLLTTDRLDFIWEKCDPTILDIFVMSSDDAKQLLFESMVEDATAGKIVWIIEREQIKSVLANEVLRLRVGELQGPHVDFYLDFLSSNSESVSQDIELLRSLCVSTHSKLQDWALQFAEKIGALDQIWLFLLESQNPKCMRRIDTHIRALAANSDLTEFILAACDSTVSVAREIGISWLRELSGAYDAKKVWTLLQEHSESEIQYLVASESNKEGVAFSEGFLSEVLRPIGKNRLVKETIKTSVTNHMDFSKVSEDLLSTLLYVARVGTDKDKSWAIRNLSEISLESKDFSNMPIKVYLTSLGDQK